MNGCRAIKLVFKVANPFSWIVQYKYNKGIQWVEDQEYVKIN